MISSAIRKIEKGKQLVRTFRKFCSAYGVNFCSVNLDRETAFLSLAIRLSEVDARQGEMSNGCRL